MKEQLQRLLRENTLEIKKEMLNIISFITRRKERKYPIQRDEYGQSLRQRAFAAFYNGQRPMQVCREFNANPKTILRYFEDWKKFPDNFRIRYVLTKAATKGNDELLVKLAKKLSMELDMPEVEALRRLQTPWGIHQLLMGNWINYRRQRAYNEKERRLVAGLKFIGILEMHGMPHDEMIQELVGFLIKARNRKKAEQDRQAKAKEE